MKHLWIVSLLVLFGCGPNEEIEVPNELDKNVESGDPYEGLSMKKAVEMHIRRELSISADQPIDYQIYRENCDGDDSLDAVIAINLLDRALDEAIKSGKVAKLAEIGFMGNYNFILYRDGFSGKFGSVMPIASSPKSKLVVSFEHIRSEKQKDILVDYRVLNASYRNFYTIINAHPKQVNQVKLFDALGTKDAVAFAVEYEPGMISNSKDIVLYQGSFTNPTFVASDEVYTYIPKITKTNRMVERWFFNPQDMKYYLKKEDSN